jgi:hypothetical protein
MILPGGLKNLSPGLRRTGVFLAWIGGIILLGGLLWFFTQPVRNRALIRSVNRILAASEAPWRLEAALSPWGMPGRASQLGTWVTLDDPEVRGVVFPVISDGLLSSCLAVLSPQGQVEALIPLSGHARRTLDSISPGALGIYVRRVEAGYALIRAEEVR